MDPDEVGVVVSCSHGCKVFRVELDMMDGKPGTVYFGNLTCRYDGRSCLV